MVLGDAIAHPSHAIYAFPPNRDTLGGTAYFIVENSAPGSANILVDCPAWEEPYQTFLQQQGGVQWLFLTHRDSIGKAREFQQAFNCKLLIQEQEAYLLPGLDVTTFHHTFTPTSQSRVLWTPGYTPGSSCLYYTGFGGVLFTGRHLLPTPQGTLMPIRTAKTFHWQRQLNSVQKLIDEFTPETLNIICPGANLGFLRGKSAVEQGYEQLKTALDNE
ncbi:MAG: MBL fold metallo-hydrolase [Oscillatoriales cyanobacterium C42_A2020_001]|nr:MBL fold metallo-hydrolase [Leptolyngbyaceae cyanobacterium C42_A2020_001]